MVPEGLYTKPTQPALGGYELDPTSTDTNVRSSAANTQLLAGAADTSSVLDKSRPTADTIPINPSSTTCLPGSAVPFNPIVVPVLEPHYPHVGWRLINGAEYPPGWVPTYLLSRDTNHALQLATDNIWFGIHSSFQQGDDYMSNAAIFAPYTSAPNIHGNVIALNQEPCPSHQIPVVHNARKEYLAMLRRHLVQPTPPEEAASSEEMEISSPSVSTPFGKEYEAFKSYQSDERHSSRPDLTTSTTPEILAPVSTNPQDAEDEMSKKPKSEDTIVDDLCNSFRCSSVFSPRYSTKDQKAITKTTSPVPSRDLLNSATTVTSAPLFDFPAEFKTIRHRSPSRGTPKATKFHTAAQHENSPPNHSINLHRNKSVPQIQELSSMLATEKETSDARRIHRSLEVVKSSGILTPKSEHKWKTVIHSRAQEAKTQDIVEDITHIPVYEGDKLDSSADSGLGVDRRSHQLSDSSAISLSVRDKNTCYAANDERQHEKSTSSSLTEEIFKSPLDEPSPGDMMSENNDAEEASRLSKLATRSSANDSQPLTDPKKPNANDSAKKVPAKKRGKKKNRKNRKNNQQTERLEFSNTDFDEIMNKYKQEDDHKRRVLEVVQSYHKVVNTNAMTQEALTALNIFLYLRLDDEVTSRLSDEYIQNTIAATIARFQKKSSGSSKSKHKDKAAGPDELSIGDFLIATTEKSLGVSFMNQTLDLTELRANMENKCRIVNDRLDVCHKCIQDVFGTLANDLNQDQVRMITLMRSRSLMIKHTDESEYILEFMKTCYEIETQPGKIISQRLSDARLSAIIAQHNCLIDKQYYLHAFWRFSAQYDPLRIINPGFRDLENDNQMSQEENRLRVLFYFLYDNHIYQRFPDKMLSPEQQRYEHEMFASSLLNELTLAEFKSMVRRSWAEIREADLMLWSSSLDPDGIPDMASHAKKMAEKVTIEDVEDEKQLEEEFEVIRTTLNYQFIESVEPRRRKIRRFMLAHPALESTTDDEELRLLEMILAEGPLRCRPGSQIHFYFGSIFRAMFQNRWDFIWLRLNKLRDPEYAGKPLSRCQTMLLSIAQSYGMILDVIKENGFESLAETLINKLCSLDELAETSGTPICKSA